AAALALEVAVPGVRILSPTSDLVPLDDNVQVIVEVANRETVASIVVAVDAFTLTDTTEVPPDGRVTSSFMPRNFGYQENSTATIRVRVTRTSGEIDEVTRVVRFANELTLPGPGEGIVRIRGTYTENSPGGTVTRDRSDDGVPATVTLNESGSQLSDDINRLIIWFQLPNEESIGLITRERFLGNGTYTLLQQG